MRRLRASPYVELKRLDELTAEERGPFLELEQDPDFYGLFIPKPPLTSTLKAVSRAAAALFESLRTPAEVDDADALELVLDGILEVESAGGFVFGADALPLLASPVAAPEPHDAVAQLSRDALLHAQDLETRNPADLTTALYLYNRIPLTPFWQTRFAGATAILGHLGVERGAMQALLDREWTGPQEILGWLAWAPRAQQRRADSGVTYKLYVSPRPERIRDAFEIVVRVLAGFPGTPFKLGNSAAGLLRPDKLVAYFPTREELDDAAGALGSELAGCDAHGVPFSAGLDERGLLSWGVDPPDQERGLRWLGRDSWRTWLARHLGSALAVAKAARTPEAVEPWLFAVDRARRHGVDVRTWTPSATLWA